MTDLFREKTFQELNAEEREQLSELCESEEEFEQMRNLFVGLESMKTEKFVPRQETKASLDAIFAAQTKQRPLYWYNTVLVVLYPQDKPIQRRPIVQVAAAILFVALIVPFLNNDAIVPSNKQLAKVIVKEKPKKVGSIIKKSLPVSNNEGAQIDQMVGSEVNEINGEDSRREAEISEDLLFTSNGIVATAESQMEELTAAAPTVASGAMAKMEVFDHPDGIFTGTVIAYSKSVKQQPAVLDLLTAAF